MSEQPKAPLSKKRMLRAKGATATASIGASKPEPMRRPEIRLDADASAALALAVSSARKKAEENGLNEEALVSAAPFGLEKARTMASRYGRPALFSAVLATSALAAGFFGAKAYVAEPAGAEQPWAEAAQTLRRSQDDVVRLTGDVKALKVSVETLKASIDQARSETAQKQAQLTERLDRSERAPQEASVKLARLGEQLDRIEAAGKAPSPKLDALAERLEQMERQIATALATAAPKPTTAAAVAPAVAEAPAQTGSLDGKAAPKDQPVEGWVLHEVYGGVALIEGSNRRLFEVGPGDMVPGVGRVEAVERRGKRWVVVTAKGVIGTVR